MTQRFTPMIVYADAPAALEFLAEAFGFDERFRMDMPDGGVGHAEIGLGDEVVMLASEWGAGGVVSPLRLPSVHAQIHVHVDDVDAHFARARAARRHDRGRARRPGVRHAELPRDRPGGPSLDLRGAARRRAAP